MGGIIMARMLHLANPTVCLMRLVLIVGVSSDFRNAGNRFEPEFTNESVSFLALLVIRTGYQGMSSIRRRP